MGVQIIFYNLTLEPDPRSAEMRWENDPTAYFTTPVTRLVAPAFRESTVMYVL